ncbi:FAD-binding molybdopterin dehydrogenase [Devosia geojensis]|uniref:FAD-binding molybdopterin dehydrogenase n=1 Tax=Devosia geojensis TaxID=443610 RepID=A0A0F5FTP8_9HYPH|nr:xanthine dehydrogenase small subunit [Devosia geojensis]KKB12244.1 FAD-binding molybdopterin dehydrogenase [Devosia geojensis]
MALRDHTRFFLNDAYVELADVPARRTVLEWIRQDLALCGTKEGCAEGDCGACTVLVGRIDPAGDLVYRSVNACITFVASLDGAHLVTVEGISSDAELHPVQQSMVDNHASQCGFCTPGIVMSLYADWLDNPMPSVADVERNLQGNLCRCTGYQPILRAAQSIADYGDAADERLNTGRAAMRDKLLALRDRDRVVTGTGASLAILPRGADDLAEVLLEMPEATIVSGATDIGVWVTKFLREPSVMVFLSHVDDLDGIIVEGDSLVIGARTSYSSAEAAITRHLPQLSELWSRIGGRQVRNAGTIGGNIANGSPIGDTPPPLIALGATLTLRRGGERRQVPLEDFFIDYGRQDRLPGEFIESVTVPLPQAGEHFAAYKVSKRLDEDISSVLGAFRLRLEDGLVSDIAIAYGGMAGTPKRARQMEAVLIAKPWTRATVDSAAQALPFDFSPLSDWRASSEYRMIAAQNLLVRFWAEMQGMPARIGELAYG